MNYDTLNEIDKKKEECFEEKEENFDKVCAFMLSKKGSFNSMTVKELAEKFNIKTRTVRLIMNDMMYKKRIPILSFDGSENGQRGFFVAETQSEADSYIESLQNKIQPLQKKISIIQELFGEKDDKVCS